MSTPVNPIKAAREARGLTRRVLAMGMGLTPERVCNLENGHVERLPETWREGMVAMGFDFDQLAAAYKAYRGELVAAARKAVANG